MKQKFKEQYRFLRQNGTKWMFSDYSIEKMAALKAFCSKNKIDELETMKQKSGRAWIL